MRAVRLSRLASVAAVLAWLLPAAVAAQAAEAAPGDSLDCLIEPLVVAQVGSRADGVLEEVLVDRGDSVRRGELLAVLDAGPERAALALARVRAQTDLQLRSAEVKLGYGQRRANLITDELLADAATTLEKDEAVTAARLARLQVHEAQRNQDLAELEVARVEALLAQRRIVSPLDGVVVERLMNPGERVTDAPVMTLAQIDPLRVEVIVPVALLGTVAVGSHAVVVPEAPVAGEYAASVTVVDRVVDARSGTFGVRLELPNPQHRLPGGLRCRVRFLRGPRPAGADGDADPSPATTLPDGGMLQVETDAVGGSTLALAGGSSRPDGADAAATGSAPGGASVAASAAAMSTVGRTTIPQGSRSPVGPSPRGDASDEATLAPSPAGRGGDTSGDRDAASLTDLAPAGAGRSAAALPSTSKAPGAASAAVASRRGGTSVAPSVDDARARPVGGRSSAADAGALAGLAPPRPASGAPSAASTSTVSSAEDAAAVETHRRAAAAPRREAAAPEPSRVPAIVASAVGRSVALPPLPTERAMHRRAVDAGLEAAAPSAAARPLHAGLEGFETQGAARPAGGRGTARLAAARAQEEAAANGPALRCLAIGPFASDADGSRVERVAADHGWDSVRRSAAPRDGRAQVLLVSLLDDDVDATGRRLRAEGFSDVGYMNSGPHAGRWSAGVFRNLEYAEERMTALRHAGFDAALTPLDGRRRYEVVLRVTGDAAVDALLPGEFARSEVACD